MTGRGGVAAGGGRVAIVGAGIVGISTAIWLQRAGHEVVLVDREGPAAGASQGNGGVLASAGVVPVTVPGLIAKAPRMLLDPDEPLFLRWSYLPRLAPWLVRYLGHCRAAEAERIAAALHGIIGESLAEHRALAAGTGAERWIVPSDYLCLYRDRAAFEADAFGWSLRARHGFQWEELEGEGFRAYDPAIASGLSFAARLGGHGRIADPRRYVEDLARHVVERGGRVVIAEATEVVRANGRAAGVRVGGATIAADQVVIAAGAWSG
ncbi:MAG TPA: FAD-dependent oxidoreductase, partial [Paracoccaceae bacterium]|nr:FAD-dependent oxidoreductase [Paracoccaceae bacterium]